MNKVELAARVATRTSMSRAGAHAAADAMFSTFADALVGRETVRTAGFGTFPTRSRPPRPGRDPRSGEPIAIAASNRPSSRPAKPFVTLSTSRFGRSAFHRLTPPPSVPMDGTRLDLCYG